MVESGYSWTAGGFPTSQLRPKHTLYLTFAFLLTISRDAAVFSSGGAGTDVQLWLAKPMERFGTILHGSKLFMHTFELPRLQRVHVVFVPGV